MSNSLFNVGLSGLNSAQYGLTTTGHNIGNASTPGYNRESVILKPASGQFTSSGYIGTGVQTDTIKRAYSASLSASLNAAQSTGAALGTFTTEAKSLNAVVGDPSGGIATNLTGFFSAAQSLSANPSDTAARTSMMGAANALTEQINAATGQMDAARGNVNTQIAATVEDINTAAKTIATLNKQITAAGAAGQPPNSLLDARDKQVSDLSNLVNVKVMTQPDGSYNVITGTGQPLVIGSQTFDLAAKPSPADPSELTIAYDGAGHGNPDAAPGYLAEGAITGGKLGGLLRFRSEMLDPAQSRLGTIAAAFAGGVNKQNAAGLDLTGKPGGKLFELGTPEVSAARENTGSGAVTARFADTAALTGDRYELSFDGQQYSVNNQTTGARTAVTKWPATVDGVEYDLRGKMAAGDRFGSTPTRGVGAALAMATTQGSAIAAATPLVAGSAAGNAGTGTVAVSDIDAAYASHPLNATVTLKYANAPAAAGAAGANGASAGGPALRGFPADQDVTITTPAGGSKTYAAPADGVPFVPGATVKFGGVSLTLGGAPKVGDTFSVAHNGALSGDGSNALKLGNLQNAKLVASGTLTQGYADYIDQVGTQASQATVASATQTTLIGQLTAQQQSVSGVNLDEEAANLMQYQQMYQANSKVIQTAGTLFDTILELVK
ncbi:flagellar hook-associated protein FlgK [Robbsia sp. Bb-Pol-6]|uniref:Flagellar hook-associated protein 1 n=1 Tax=Robbsia betulipollinis TaxID=2981849 RepID=A0ABT3ZHK1_9BURK|nr:flagellar hook-associated protein FlgK [Robbsia betulipollinis]MCY0386009.1 flagellar hook-associated protein FlgK [Robbsia betulipollinis]